MADAFARGKRPRGGRGPETTEDAFVEGALRFWGWVQDHLRTFVILLSVVALVVVGGWYWRGYRETVRERAAVELSQLRAAARADTEGVVPRLESFVARFDGTEAATEARLMLAREHLAGGRAEEALPILEAIDAPPDVPLGHAALRVRAAAYEQLGQPERALEVYRRLGQSARYPFQRRDARADAARILADTGGLAEAEQILVRLVEEAEAAESPSEAAEYRIRLGEVRGRLHATG